METYLFKFSGCLLVFWLVYILFLERQTMHRFKRFYLLGAVASALIIPVLTITHYIEPIVTDFEVAPLFIPIEPVFTEIPLEQAPFWTLETILWMLYGSGVLLFSIRFTVNLFKMYKRISNNETIMKRSFVYVLLEEYRIPHSFFKYIFFNKLKYKKHSIPKEVMLHEETHAKQLHSLDVLVIELLQIIFWFNPLIYILKYHIKLNHEFLADQAVLNQGSDAKTYQNILLQFSSNTQEYQLSSAINYSSIKKRFTVMKTQTSKTRIWVSGLLLLPIIAILFYGFAEKEYVEKETIETSEVLQIENDTLGEGATETMMQEYNDWIKKLNNKSSSLFIPVGTWERLVAIYDLMSEEQRNSVESHPFLQEMGDMYKEEAKTPTTTQFESWKNEKEFAIWIDNKHVSNSELNNYKVKDITHYFGSKVLENARNQKFPQPFQFHLYTKDGFNKFFTEVYVKGYKEICNEYSIALNRYLKGPQTDNSELRIIKAQADKFYNQFTKEDLKKHNILPTSPIPTQKQNNLKTALNNSINSVSQNYYPIPPPIPENATPTERKKMQQAIDEFEKTYKRKVHTTKNEETGELINLIANDEVYQIEERTQEKPIMLILINRKDQLLVNDELGTLKSIENKLKKLAGEGKTGQLVSIKYDRETSEEMISKVEELVKVNKFKIVSFDISPIMWILINRHGQLLVDDEIGTLKSIEDKLKKLAKAGKTGSLVSLRYDKETSKEIISKVEALVNTNKFKVASFDASIPLPPPPPTNQEKATVKQIADYNTWAKKINTAMAKAEDNNDVNAYPIVKVKEVNKYKAIYDSMTAAQKKASEPWPSFPPPPPPPPAPNKSKGGPNANVKTGFHQVNGQTLYYTAKKGQTTYYNRWGQKVNRKGDVINSEQTHAEDVIEGQVISKVYKEDKVIAEFNTDNVSIPPPPPPPPAPESTLDFVIRMAKANAKFFYELKPISSDKAIDLLKKKPKLNINARKVETKHPIIYISKKPMLIGVKGKVGEKMPTNVMVNGKKIKSPKLEMTRSEFKNLKLSTKEGKVTSFKFKIPGKPTQSIEGNTIDLKTVKNLESIKKDDNLVLFDIKDGSDLKIESLVITITD